MLNVQKLENLRNPLRGANQFRDSWTASWAEPPGLN